MKTAIMTDSNSGITKKDGERLGLYVIPMPVIIDGRMYYEGENLSEETFYSELLSGASVSTSQPSPGDVMDLWENIFADGYDQIVYIPMSSGLSNSCETATALAMEFKGRVYVADNHRISVTMLESVMYARDLAGQGMTGEEIKARLEQEAYCSSIYVAVNTLEYLKKGGRITPAAALLGSVLNIKPVLTIQGEKLDSFAKARGMKKCEALMVQAIKNDLKVRFSGYDRTKLRIGAAGAGLSEQEQGRWSGLLKENFPEAKVYYSPLSVSIGCHTGPGAVGVGVSFR